MIAHGILEDGHLAGPLFHEEIAALSDKSDTRGVVAAVFEASQPIEQDGSGVSRSRVADDSAHKQSSGLVTTAPGEGG